MKAQIVEQVELFSEAELESLEFTPEELEAIEAERVPDLDSVSFEDIAEDLEVVLESRRPRPLSVALTPAMIADDYRRNQEKLMKALRDYKNTSNPFKKAILLVKIKRLKRKLRI